MSEPEVDPRLIAEILAQVRGESLLERFDCGCEIGNIGDAFVIRPCSMTCEKYRYAVAEGKRQSKPMAFGWEGDVN